MTPHASRGGLCAAVWGGGAGFVHARARIAPIRVPRAPGRAHRGACGAARALPLARAEQGSANSRWGLQPLPRGVARCRPRAGISCREGRNERPRACRRARAREAAASVRGARKGARARPVQVWPRGVACKCGACGRRALGRRSLAVGAMCAAGALLGRGRPTDAPFHPRALSLWSCLHVQLHLRAVVCARVAVRWRGKRRGGRRGGGHDAAVSAGAGSRGS